jgi:hypothetical protein
MKKQATNTLRSLNPATRKALGRLKQAPFSVAAPSFVVPDTVCGNARLLAPHFSEIALLLFEARACLDYDETDLAPDLAGLDVDWHVHLPLDLNWGHGGTVGLDSGWKPIAGLLEKVDYLSPRAYVLHPPVSPDLLAPLAARFRDAGVAPGRILLENVHETDLANHWEAAQDAGFRICLDLGHMLHHGQQHLLRLPNIWHNVDMLHIYAPGQGERHESLARLDEQGREMLGHWLQCWKTHAVHGTRRCMTLEIFNETKLLESAGLLADWLEQWKVST